jgi:hypothetical protein
MLRAALAEATLCVEAHHFAPGCIICNAAFAERHLKGGIGPAEAHFAVESVDSVGQPTIYKRIQERLDWLEVPSISPIASFNFESSAA